MKYYYAKCTEDKFMDDGLKCFSAGNNYLAKDGYSRGDLDIWLDDLQQRDHQITGDWITAFQLEEIDEATYKLLINL